MKAAPLPPNFKPPFWATRNFRWFIIMTVMGAAVLAVMIFEIGPALNARPQREAKANPNAFVPKPLAPGEASPVRFEGVLAKVKDGTPIDDQDQPYQYLVRALSRMEPAQVAKDAKTVEYKYYSKMPVEMRGETVKILALFLQSNPIRVDAAPGGVNFIHRTYLSDLSGNEGYVVDLLEPPGDLPQRTLVGMDAVFLKLGTYEGRKGSVQAPLFLGKSLHTVKEKMAEGTGGLSPGVLLGVAVGAMAVTLVLTHVMFRAPKPAPKGPAISPETLKA